MSEKSPQAIFPMEYARHNSNSFACLSSCCRWHVTCKLHSVDSSTMGNWLMSFDSTGDRWQAAATTASSSTLADRWRITTRQWIEAKAEYLRLYEAEVTNVSALRKAAQRLHDLGQLRKVLASGLG
jgi:hypothetical protein